MEYDEKATFSRMLPGDYHDTSTTLSPMLPVVFRPIPNAGQVRIRRYSLNIREEFNNPGINMKV